MIGRTYHERGEPVVILARWQSSRPAGTTPVTVHPAPSGRGLPTRGTGPRNVLIRRPDGSRVVRPFRGLRRPAPQEVTDALF
ncbi:hypothetical protein [Streptosporangium saharense]|uniref:Acetyl esterase n=1 Tax=Streptosporangium saharense TaxID=1706840 RepID=A0A7W7QGT8_9ACTN|nr:hypothetical protein [Streptosporangium saharense]MBB4913327.1 acetyl esterase [Streptosporangium saharense]